MGFLLLHDKLSRFCAACGSMIFFIFAFRGLFRVKA